MFPRFVTHSDSILCRCMRVTRDLKPLSVPTHPLLIPPSPCDSQHACHPAIQPNTRHPKCVLVTLNDLWEEIKQLQIDHLVQRERHRVAISALQISMVEQRDIIIQCILALVLLRTFGLGPVLVSLFPSLHICTSTFRPNEPLLVSARGSCHTIRGL
ncbi:hypothetical protein F5141DRAFT_1112974 [Pisolithus sp. B1]|nr:hypothetical protein F5141DRAFT_1112974 [Pisolithus sp. B1]